MLEDSFLSLFLPIKTIKREVRVMKIDIVPIIETRVIHIEEKSKAKIKDPAIAIRESTTTPEDIFARFLMMEVGSGAASTDTIRNYLSQTKQYLEWCKDNLLSPIEAEPEDIKLYRQHLVNSGYASSTIATKLNIIRIFYKAAQNHGLISNNPVAKIKAPKDRKDPAARITFLEAEELKYLLDHLQSQLEQAKTKAQRLVLLRVAKPCRRLIAF